MRTHIGKVFGSCVSALLLAGLCIGVAEAMQCVSPDIANCHGTIQEAVQAASPGEVVAVYPGTYAENVIVGVGKSGVQVVGKGSWPGQVVIRPVDGNAVWLNAPQAQLRNVSVLGGEAGVVVTGVGATISAVHVKYAVNGIVISADNILVSKSSILQTSSTGISATGAGLVVRDALVQRAGGTCIHVEGGGALVEQSRMVDCGGEGVKISGDAASVLENKLLVSGSYMIEVAGAAATVRGNLLEGGRDAAIRVVSSSPKVVKNSARNCEVGIDVYCTSCVGGQVADNDAQGTYNCPGFVIEADGGGLQVLDNTSRDSSEEGFLLSGAGMVVRGNRALNNFFDGFSLVLSSNVQFLDNRADKNAMNGIRIWGSATGTIVEKNCAHANGGVDFYDAGTGTILGDGGKRNHFGTVGGP